MGRWRRHRVATDVLSVSLWHNPVRWMLDFLSRIARSRDLKTNLVAWFLLRGERYIFHARDWPAVGGAPSVRCVAGRQRLRESRLSRSYARKRFKADTGSGRARAMAQMRQGGNGTN